MDQYPDISQKTVERALTELMASGEIIKIGGGHMYYILSEKYRLRGWDKLPYALVNTEKGEVSFFRKDKMQTLLRCDGSWDFDTVLSTDEERSFVAELSAKGIIVPCEPGAVCAPEQRYRFYENRFVQIVHWSTTGRCNYRCRHCFMSAPEAKYGELSHRAVIEIARQIGRCGIPSVNLTGGEALIRPDFMDIAGELTAQGVRIWQLYTNGALLTADVLDGLTALGHHPAVIISYDGVGWHDWMRGVPGAGEAADRALRLCAERGFQTSAQVTLFRDNIGKMRETVLHLAGLGCSSIRFGIVDDAGEWLKNGTGHSLTQNEFREAALRYIPEYYEDGMPAALILAGLFMASPDRPDEYDIFSRHLNAGRAEGMLLSCARSTMQLFADGRIAVCEELGPDFVGMPPVVTDDPEQETCTLSDVLKTGSPYMKLMDTRRDAFLAENRECAECEFLNVCGGGCRAGAHRSCGSIYGKDPVTCSFFREGWLQRVTETVRRVCPGARSRFDAFHG